jgi:hypothetical protein
MARAVCTICTHPKKTEIDAALVAGAMLKTIAEEFGVNRQSVGRHAKHVIELIGKPKEANKGSDAASMIEELLELEEHLASIYATASRNKDHKLRLSIIDKRVALIKFRAELSGAIKLQKPGAGSTSGRSEGFHGDLEGLVERAARRFSTKPS